jgi:hypothetical protein
MEGVVIPKTNAEKIDALRRWQQAGYVHELTCGHNSTHPPLVPGEQAGIVILECSECGYTQTDIPEVCYNVPPNPFV